MGLLGLCHHDRAVARQEERVMRRIQAALWLGAVVGLMTAVDAQAWYGRSEGHRGVTIAQGPGGLLNPLTVPGTTVTVVDTPTGAAMTFVAAPASVEDVRARVRAMAARHNTGGAPGGSRWHGQMPPARASAEDVPDGARLIFEAEDPAQLQNLRNDVRAHADWLRSRPAVP
jgi:hypothetical protein